MRFVFFLAAFYCVASPAYPAKIGLVGNFPEGRGDDWQAAKLAFEEAAGLDKDAEAVKQEVFDDRGTTAAAVKAARKLAEDPEAWAVVLHGEPAACAEALEIYRAAGLAVISASSYASPRPLSSSALWMAPKQEEMAALAGSYAFQMMKFKQSAVVDDGSPTASASATAFATAFRRAGGKVVYDGEWQGSDWGLTRTSAALKANWPQVVFYAGPADNAARLADEMSAKMKDKGLLMGGPSLLEPDYAKNAKAKIKGSVAVFVCPSYRMMRRQKTLNRFEKAAYAYFGHPGQWGSQLFDAARLALKAVREAGEDGRAGAKKYLLGLKSFSGIQGKVELDSSMSPAEPKIAIFMVWPSKKQKKKMTYLEKNFGPPWTRQR